MYFFLGIQNFNKEQYYSKTLNQLNFLIYNSDWYQTGADPDKEPVWPVKLISLMHHSKMNLCQTKSKVIPE